MSVKQLTTYNLIGFGAPFPSYWSDKDESGLEDEIPDIDLAPASIVLDYSEWAKPKLQAGAERVLDYSSWARQPVPYFKNATMINPPKPLSPKVDAIMAIFRYKREIYY